MSLTSMPSQHRVSDFLKDRHPYPGAAPFDPLKSSVAFGYRGVPRLCEILAHKDLPLENKREAIEAVLKVMSHQETKNRFTRAENLGRFVELMSDEDGVVREYATKIVASVCQLMQGRQAVFKAKGLEALRSKLGDNDKYVREAAATSLSFFTQSVDGRQIVAREALDVVAGLVSVLNDDYPAVAHHAVVSVGNLMREDTAIERALQEGVVKSLIALLKRREFPSQQEVLACFLNLCAHQKAKTQSIRDGAVTSISTFLTHPDKEMRRLSCATLTAIAIDEVGKKTVMAICLEEVLQLLYDPEKEIIAIARAALRNVCGDPRAREKMISIMKKDPSMLADIESDLRQNLASDWYR